MKIRNANGFGSITKLSGNRRRPYMVRKTERIDSETGRQIMTIIGYYEKYPDAMRALIAYNEKGGVITPAVTFENAWDAFTRDKYTSCDKDIPAVYKTVYNRVSALYTMNLKDITISVLKEHFEKCETAVVKSNFKVVMNQLFKYAIQNELTEKNPAENLIVPEIKQSGIHSSFTDDEIKLLWEHSNELSARLWLIYIYTGMRPSELRHIKIADVHLNENYMVGGMKNDYSKNRAIPIANCIKPIIADMITEGETYLLRAKFTNLKNDRMISAPTLRGYLDEFMNENALEHLPHDGRHTCATLLDRVGVNIVTIQRILGQSSRTVVGKVYIHKTITDMVDAVNKLPTFCSDKQK